MAQEQSIQINISPVKWEVLEFRNKAHRYETGAEVKIGLHVEHTWNMDVPNDMISLLLRITIGDTTTEEEKEIAHLAFQGVFNFTNLSQFQQAGGLEVPAEPMLLMAAMVYDTARGVLIGRGMGSFIEQVALP